MTIQQSVPPSKNEFTEEEMSYISDHMAACAGYLEHLEILWFGDSEEDEEASVSAEITTPSIPPAIAEKLQNRVKNNIQRGDLGANALKLSTQGMMEVLLALIRPILNDNSSSKSKDK